MPSTTTVPFAPVRFQDVLNARHQEALLRHHHPSVVAGDDAFWETVPLSREAVLHAVAGVKAACQMRTLHGDGLTALLWLVPVWTDDELGSMLHHPDVRTDSLVASEMRIALDQRAPVLDPTLDGYSPGPSRHTTFEAIDRANRALHRVGLVHPRSMTLPEHIAQIFLEHEDRHTRTFEAAISALAAAQAHTLIERLNPYTPNERCRQACETALGRAVQAAFQAAVPDASPSMASPGSNTP